MPPAQTPALGCFPKKGHLGCPFCQSHSHFLQVGLQVLLLGRERVCWGGGT